MRTPTILIVEDNPITRKMLRVALESEGYAALEAENGRTALELAAKTTPDLVLQDLALPDMDGFDLVRQLRAVPGIADIPILALSGFLAKIQQAQVHQLGFTDYLFKPVEPSRLLRTVQAYVLRVGPGEERPGRGRQVLLVDDDPIQLKLQKLHLEQSGFRVTTAGDGAQALEHARRSRPDAIVSDVLMPRLDGFKLCVAIRGDPRLTHVPVILTSAYFIDETDEKLARQVGASAFVVRTTDARDTVEAILASLREAPPAMPAGPVELPTEEYALRVLRQLERQVGLNVSVTRRIALLEAEIGLIVGLAESLRSSWSVDTILRELLYRCVDAAGLSRGAAYLVEPDGRLSLRSQFGYPDENQGPLAEFFGRADLLHDALEAGDPVAVPSSQVPAEQVKDLLVRAGARWILIIPLRLGEERLGVVAMASASSRFDPDWAAFAKVVSSQVSQAIGLARAISRLAASEQRYRSLFASARNGMILASETGRIEDANPAACALAGLTPEEIRGLEIGDLLPAVVQDQMPGQTGALPKELPLARRNGGQKLVEVSVREVPPGLRLYVLHDVTEQRHLQEQVIQAEKLATMGQLLAGVAHELNNPLAVVIGRAALISAKLSGGPLASQMEKLGQAAERCARIVKSFLALARQRRPERQRVALNQVAQEAVELLAYPLRMDDVTVNLDLAPDLPVLWADPDQLHQVVVNLISNAHQAMRQTPQPRRLTISTRHDSVRRHVTLAVADTGPGIPPEVRSRLFEPFFTTKPPGQGTGLGLSLCKGVVENHGGSIWVESKPGSGASFLIEVPVEPAPVGELRTGAPDPLPPIRGKTILVVDDEREIATMLAEVLSADGHQVETAENGAIALEKLRKRTYDLILSDLRMPELNGPDLHRELERRHPQLLRRIIFLTGDTLGPEISKFLETSRVPGVSKPFKLEEIRAVVQRTLRAAETG